MSQAPAQANCQECPTGIYAEGADRFGTQRQRSERGPTKSPRAPAIGLILYGNYTVRPGPPEFKSPFGDFYLANMGIIQSDEPPPELKTALRRFFYLKIFFGSLILIIPTIKSTNAHIQTIIPGIINNHPIVPINNIAIPSPERPA